MHKIVPIPILLLLLFATGCQTTPSAEQTAFRVIGTITTTVDGSMKGWGSYVRSLQSTPEEEAKVKKAYVHYQSVMRATRDVVESLGNSPDGQPLVQKALAAAQSASAELVRLISELAFKPTPKGPTP